MKIEKNIPLPSTWKNSGKRPGAGGVNKIYPFGEMEIGDSIFTDLSNYKKARDASYQFGKRNNLKFICRLWGQKNNIGGRIWRIE